MTAKLIRLKLGPWPMNCYIILCSQTKKCAIVDPGADPEKIQAAVSNFKVEKILITHGHNDHIGALKEIKEFTNAPVHIHHAEAKAFGIDFDIPLHDGDQIKVGNQCIKVIHTPGHTPGLVCYDLLDKRKVVGDTIFVFGPEATKIKVFSMYAAEDFNTTMATLKNIVFAWPDDTQFFPGHGPSGLIGNERPLFEKFMSKGREKDQ